MVRRLCREFCEVSLSKHDLYFVQCLQLCPWALAFDNYIVSRPGLVLLKKHPRLIEPAVFLAFRLPFCPDANRSEDNVQDWGKVSWHWDAEKETVSKGKKKMSSGPVAIKPFLNFMSLSDSSRFVCF